MKCDCNYCGTPKDCEACGERLPKHAVSAYCVDCRNEDYDHSEALHRHEEDN